MRITKYTAAKHQGNTIGFLGIEINCTIDGVNIPMCCDLTIMRNTHNGHLFVNWPSKPYQAPDGKTKYASQIKWPKEQLDFIQNAIIKRFHEMINSNRDAFQQTPQQKIDYPMNSPKQNREYKEHEQEELPF